MPPMLGALTFLVAEWHTFSPLCRWDFLGDLRVIIVNLDIAALFSYPRIVPKLR